MVDLGLLPQRQFRKHQRFVRRCKVLGNLTKFVDLMIQLRMQIIFRFT